MSKSKLGSAGVLDLLGRRQQIGQDGAGRLQLSGDVAVAGTVATAPAAVDEPDDSRGGRWDDDVGLQLDSCGRDPHAVTDDTHRKSPRP